jgi:hypothetical protein
VFQSANRPAREPTGWETAELASRVATVHRLASEGDAGELRYVASRLTGKVRLLAGMVRANRPGRALLGLSKLLVGAFGTAAFGLTTDTIWQMGGALGALRLIVILLVGPIALVAWLIIAYDLWERPGPDTPAEFGSDVQPGHHHDPHPGHGGVLCRALCRNGARRGAADRHIRAGTEPGRAVHASDYLTLAWIISSPATVGGAIGSGLEDEETVRAAAYGYHPEPDG